MGYEDQILDAIEAIVKLFYVLLLNVLMQQLENIK